MSFDSCPPPRLPASSGFSQLSPEVTLISFPNLILFSIHTCPASFPFSARITTLFGRLGSPCESPRTTSISSWPSLLEITQGSVPHLELQPTFPSPPPGYWLTTSDPFHSPHSSNTSSSMGSLRALPAQGLCTCQEHPSPHSHMARSLPPFRSLLSEPLPDHPYL